MRLARTLTLALAVVFFCSGLVLVPQFAAAGPPGADQDWLPPGLAKKLDTGEGWLPPGLAKKQDDKEKGPAWARDEHPSVKGLKNAYRNLCRNNTSIRARERLAEKIRARGGQIDDIEEISDYTIEVNGTPDLVLEPGETTNDLSFLLKDEEGNPFNLAGNYKIELRLEDENNVLTQPEDGTDLTASDMSETEGVTETITVTAADDAEGTAKIRAILYEDTDEDNRADYGERLASVCANYTVAGGEENQALTCDDSDLAFAAAAGDFDYVAPTGERITFTYILLDSEGYPVDASEDTKITWEVKNSGDADIVVNGTTIVEPDGVYTLNTTIQAGDDDETITVEADDETTVEISAQVKGDSDTLEIAALCFYAAANELASDDEVTVEGTLAAYNGFENDSDGTAMLIDTGDGYYYLPSNTRFEEINCGNEEDLTESDLEDYMEVGDNVTITLDDDLEDESGDLDTITITR